jgi:putative addiction module component (TIGR02574 family)
MGAKELIAEFGKLNKTEKIILVEELWDSIDDGTDDIPVPEWHVSELDKRYSAYKTGNMELYDWQDVHREIRKKLQ